jgi:RNA polymerase sigma-54 factor
MLQHHLAHDLRPQATAHLAQTMSFLQMPTTELEAALLKELSENPALELVEELRCPECGKRLTRAPCPACAAPRGEDAPVVYVATRETTGQRAYRADEREPADDFEPRSRERLDEYILRQIAPALREAERPIAAYLLARLDEDGLLPETTAEVAAFTRAPLSAVEHVLDLIQHADPPGVGARSPSESLLIQMGALCENSAQPQPIIALARSIIQGHFEHLARRDHARIARALRAPVARVDEAALFIQRNLTPFPARAFWGEGTRGVPEPNALTYRDPDVNISLVNRNARGPLVVEVFTPLSGWLRINPELKAALNECEGSDRAKWAQAVERAGLIAKCLQQRNHTMRRLMEIIAVRQRAFILGGDGDLRPLTRSQVARALDVHESTISRAVAGKSVALPSGRIVPLAKFFDRSLSVRDRVRVIVEAETRPLTDDEIAVHLAADGLRVARRTVAKYRNMLGILPATLRVRARQAHASLAR